MKLTPDPKKKKEISGQTHKVKKGYSLPKLTVYGKMSEITQFIPQKSQGGADAESS